MQVVDAIRDVGGTVAVCCFGFDERFNVWVGVKAGMWGWSLGEREG